MAKRAPSRSDHLRSAVAQEAARLMAQHGIQDYLVAKRKAAERYGVADAAFLPRNSEVEEALVSYQRLFGGQRHNSSVQEKRRVALEVMQVLARFEPRLVGAVLAGSATEFADIQLHVFSDSQEEVYLHLLDRRINSQVIERRVRMGPDRQAAVPGLSFTLQDSGVEVLVFPRNGIRQAPVSPVDGKPMRRADAAEIRALLAQT